MITASGILFQSKFGRVLFLKRGNGGDYPGSWCFPGGRQEEGETLADCAIRETQEETGHTVDVLGAPFTRRISKGVPTPTPPEAGVVADTQSYDEDVDFTTYRVVGCDEFTPVLNDEHTAYAWARADGPPEPLHPGAAIAIARLGANELDIARMVSRGELVSPTRFENISIFALRMSGVGVAFRKGINEFVFRDPKIWLSQEMIDRCAGVPLIYVHPEKSVLNSEEFADRVVGTIMFGYLKDNELWCTARVYDSEVISLLEENKMSTSPAVVFRDPDANTTMRVEDGTPLLIEGAPTLLDHLAICGLKEDGTGVPGVWDKGAGLHGIDQVGVKADADLINLPVRRKPDYRLLAAKTTELNIKMRSVLTRFRV